MNNSQDTISRQFFLFLKSQIISEKNVFESKVCRSKSLSATIIFKNGNKYRGDVSPSEEMDGKGRFDWEEGDYFQGDFKADKINGKGTMAYQNCSKIAGSLQNGVPHGECRLVTKSLKYIGNYEYGKKCGNGVFYEIDGTKETLLFDGKWLNGEKHEGTRYYENGIYKGTFLDNERYNGTYTFSNDETYVGQFANNKFDGYGVYTWPEYNTSYEGYWQNGKKHGFGVIKINELLVMTIWDNNLKFGPGLIKCYNGDILISPEMFSEDFLRDANLLGTYSTIQLTALLTNPSESKLNNFIALHQQLSVYYNLYIISPFLVTDSYINIHQTDQIIRFLMYKYIRYDLWPAYITDSGKTINEVINYEIIHLRSIIAKLSNFLISIYQSRNLNRQINLWNFIIQINNISNLKAYPFNLLQTANENFNLLITNLNDPNEMIAFYQFLKLLIFMGITIYGEELCKSELIGNISYCFLKLIRTMMKMYDQPFVEGINLAQFYALDDQIKFAQYETLKLREFVASALKKRRILKWAEEELFQAIEAIIPRFQYNGFVLDFHIPITPLEFYLMYRKLIEIALMRE